jgi:hypothetical protein
MTIVIDRPPNFAQILAAFPNADKPGVMFAYNGAIYNPSSVVIPPALLAHEQVHLDRQKALDPPKKSTTKWFGADLWWQRYIDDSEFRYNEELLAHAAEYRAQAVGDRNFCAGLLVRTAARLTATLYAYEPPVAMQKALKDLKQELAK